MMWPLRERIAIWIEGGTRVGGNSDPFRPHLESHQECRRRRGRDPEQSRLPSRTAALAAVATALLAFVAFPAGAGDGDLDGSFNGGTVVLPLPPLIEGFTEGIGVRVQPDGRIVVLAAYYVSSVGDAEALLLYRYLPNGTLDPSFGSNGIAVLEPSPYALIAKALELTPDGKIVVGVSEQSIAGWRWLIGRMLNNGAPDPAFGFTGWQAVDFPVNCCEDYLGDLAVGADSSVVAVGSTRVAADATYAGFARLGSSGFLDPTFGVGGLSTADMALGFPDRFNGAYDVLLEPSTGALVFGGQVEVGSASFWAIGRVGSSGAFDPAFSVIGYRVEDFEVLDEFADSERVLSVCRHADGSYLGVGDFWGTDPQRSGALIRLLADGSIDDSWGSLGYTEFGFGALSTYNAVAACALDRAQRAVCVGTRREGTTQTAGIARFVGPLYDARYRGGGADYFGFDLPGTNWASDVTFDLNGRILVTGSVLYPGGMWRAGLARLIGGLPFVDGFESGDLSGWTNAAVN